jgi:hypothetical protein
MSSPDEPVALVVDAEPQVFGEEDGNEPVSERVGKASLPPTTIEAFDDDCRAFLGAHGFRFTSVEDAIYFNMLPLDKKQKLALLDSMTGHTK